MNPPAGWHPDPFDPSVDRYWDGERWTEQTRPKGSDTPTQVFGSVDPGATRRPRKRSAGSGRGWSAQGSWGCWPSEQP
ncbi:DUF2510 domain-containing protein [Rhodococcus sp. BL-253-APC-6A1W]|uniref:DUF2510 domain-containing protein n=1 Tax=Rhodococcus sp. BL-253-APC-6A1W TaxID=2725307 RepID=UPI00146CA9A4|nr:DUF2510 domain-containing protein [Rhodococcus sp. BL-253-APC-6A1W]NMD97707.1 DUF2510 domain-containing protein [Rhodococcus sp. BL-253-APC-6A1W]